ncbi:response regulator [Tolypothrix sp. FACHB-123]|uniref:response regulator n=1 Tax=Tolypothrix sp. FACHB-123 TaxID=2692868 RepID=UPI0016898E5B|nr:response regulator [Tolypothrix sp. FACHB-123]MBD2356205.1 response regulator [Tolypothrix sp. FACHB-123]
MVLDFGIKNNIARDFIPEALGLLQQIHNGLLDLPHNYSAAKMRTLVRVAQLIKDAAIQVGLTDIHNLTYRLEKIFRLLSLENQMIDANIIGLLRDANEYLGLILIAQVQDKTDDAVNLLAKAESVFANLESRNHHQQLANSPQSANLDRDLSYLVHTTEVTQAIHNLEIILAQTETENLVEKLKLAANVFLGFGDRLKIAEFVAIAQVTLTTLQASPKAAHTIGCIALEGWRTVYEGIFKQDITSEQQPIYQSITNINPDIYDPTQPRRLKTSQLFVWMTCGKIFTINSHSVEEILVAKADQIVYSQQQWFLHWRGKMLPTYQLSKLLTHGKLLPANPHTQAVNADEYGEHQPEPILIVRLGQQIFALQPEIESLIAEPELAIQPLASSVKFPSYVYGLTTWQDSLLEVIDVAALLNQTIENSLNIHPSAKLLDVADAGIVSKKPTILVVDDSNSVRHIVSFALQKVGYKVLQAKDGQEAITQLQQNSHIQLVICDIEMPNMNGFEFLSYRLKDPFLATIPVVMLSTCTTSKHRLLAMQLGATTYFTKPYVEQEFLAALKLIVEQKG